MKMRIYFEFILVFVPISRSNNEVSMLSVIRGKESGFHIIFFSWWGLALDFWRIDMLLLVICDLLRWHCSLSSEQLTWVIECWSPYISSQSFGRRITLGSICWLLVLISWKLITELWKREKIVSSFFASFQNKHD